MKKPRAAAIAAANDVGFFDRLDCLHRRQPWVSGSDTHQPDPAARTHEG
jgi:hypothetical protein